MKNYLFSLCLLCCTAAAAQTLNVPSVTYASGDDYARQNDKVVEIVNHLQNFPADVYTTRRKEAVSYLTTWFEGTPDVDLTLEEYTQPYLQYGEARVIYLGEYAKQMLREPETDRLSLNLAAMESVLNYYRDNIDVFGKNAAFDKLAKLQEKGKLAKFIEKQLS